MLYLKTKSAGAPILAQLIDEAELPGVVATLAAHTIFVMVDGDTGLKNLSEWVGTDEFERSQEDEQI